MNNRQRTPTDSINWNNRENFHCGDSTTMYWVHDQFTLNHGLCIFMYQNEQIIYIETFLTKYIFLNTCKYVKI